MSTTIGRGADDDANDDADDDADDDYGFGVYCAHADVTILGPYEIT